MQAGLRRIVSIAEERVKGIREVLIVYLDEMNLFCPTGPADSHVALRFVLYRLRLAEADRQPRQNRCQAMGGYGILV